MLHFMLLLSLLPGADPGFKIPHLKDETALVRIKGDAPTYIAKEFIICGDLQIDDYYNYGYRKMQDDFHSLKFREVGATSKDVSLERCYLYMERLEEFKPVIDRLAKESARGKDKNFFGLHSLARIRVTLHPDAYEKGKQWNMLEVVDVQFSTPDHQKWESWVIDVAKQREEKKAAEAEKAQRLKAKREEERKKQAAEAEAAEERAAEFESKRWRTFKNPDGKEIKARYQSITDGNVKFIDENGKSFKLPLAKLSKEEQAWIKQKPWIDPENPQSASGTKPPPKMKAATPEQP